MLCISPWSVRLKGKANVQISLLQRSLPVGCWLCPDKIAYRGRRGAQKTGAIHIGVVYHDNMYPLCATKRRVAHARRVGR